MYLSCVMGDGVFVLYQGWGWEGICPVSWGMVYLSCVSGGMVYLSCVMGVYLSCVMGDGLFVLCHGNSVLSCVMGMVYLSCVMGDGVFVLCHEGWCICPVSHWCSVAGGRPESGLQRSGQLHAEGAPGLLVPALDLEWL